MTRRPRAKIWFLISVLLLLGGGVFLALSYTGVLGKPIAPGTQVSVEQPAPESTTQEEAPAATVTAQGSTEPVDFVLETVASDLFVPWSVVFPSENRILLTERDGAIRQIVDGSLQEAPLFQFETISTISEEGLMGMALDPDYATNRYVYVCIAYPKGDGLVDRVVRFEDTGSSFQGETTILDDIPAARFHAGCRVKFGPDEKLYVTTGDATNPDDAQNRDSLAGKILRLNADGSIPEDNPFADSFVYSYGHRNPQGIDWHPVSEVLIETEHGPSGNDGPGGGDEVNRIDAGQNYGWPLVSHDNNQAGLMAPLVQYTPAEAPGSAEVYSGALFPQWENALLFGALRGEGIMVVHFTNSQASAVKSYEKLDIAVGRVREVVEAPDGTIYFTTSNQDGRGTLRTGDDKLYRIIPQK